MTLNDFLKRVSESDRDKMIIYKEGEGWTNINVEVTNTDYLL